MSKLAYERMSAQRKVKLSELRELEEKPNPGNLLLRIGKYKNKGIRLAELIMTDPAYFYWAYYSGALKQYDPWLEFEAWKIIQKAAHLRPPRPRPDSWEFAMYFDRAGRFLDFKIVKKSEKLKARKGLLRVKHLDVSLVSNLGLKGKRACALMVKRIQKEFFPKGKLAHRDYQEFFERDRNFDVDCRETHCPKIPRRVAVKRTCRGDDEADD